jgi:hypothetical protein
MKRTACLLLLASCLLALPSASLADTVIYNDLDTNPLYFYSTPPPQLYQDFSVFPQWWAMPFTPSANYQLTQISAALEWNANLNAGEGLELMTNNGGIPGGVIQTWMLPPLPAFGTCCPLQTVSPTNVNVTAGTEYWLVFTVSLDFTEAYWDLNDVGAMGQVDQLFGTVWTPMPNMPLGAFEVLGTSSGSGGSGSSTSEPGTLLLLGMGLAGFMVLQRKMGYRLVR